MLKLYRYVQLAVAIPGRKYLQAFRDEHGKITVAKYSLVGIIDTNLRDFKSYVYKLDKRSIRYMRRVNVIENKSCAVYYSFAGKGLPPRPITLDDC